MLEELREEIYGDFHEIEETEAEKKSRQAQETEETIQMLCQMGNQNQ